MVIERRTCSGGVGIGGSRESIHTHSPNDGRMASWFFCLSCGIIAVPSVMRIFLVPLPPWMSWMAPVRLVGLARAPRRPGKGGLAAHRATTLQATPGARVVLGEQVTPAPWAAPKPDDHRPSSGLALLSLTYT